MAVGKGTASGELLRRYWHPVAVAREVKDLPVAVRALGEDLILFKTPRGEFGLVYPRMLPSQRTLYYGKVKTAASDAAITDGCSAPTANASISRASLTVATSARTIASHGIQLRNVTVWSSLNMGLAKLPAGSAAIRSAQGCFSPANQFEPDGHSLGSGGDVIAPCNWFQHWEKRDGPLSRRNTFIRHSAESSSSPRWPRCPTFPSNLRQSA